MELDKSKIKYIEHRLEFERSQLLDILPNFLKLDFDLQSYIAGGCIYSIYNDESPKDYDFFVYTEGLAKQIRDYFSEHCGYHGKISGGEYNGYPLLVTDNAVSIGKYQIITQWVGTPKEVISQFDFLHNMFYYEDGKLQTLSDFKYLTSKKLYYNEKRARDIVHSLMRVNKYIKRGMDVNQKEFAKMVLALDKTGISLRERENLDYILDSKEDDSFDHAGS